LLDHERAKSIVGLAIGAYTILSQLGVGGMAEVYLAEDSRLGRKVAIKLMLVSFSSERESAALSARGSRRLRAEASEHDYRL
jgi:serine/threonine protein kinase